MIDFNDSRFQDLKDAAALLERENYTCVLKKGEHQVSSQEHGVRPLLQWIREGREFSGYSAADQVVGKAAALLYAGLGVTRLYGKLLSEKAIPVLEAHRIEWGADRMVPYIKNRAGDDMCPMEKTVLEIDAPQEAAPALEAKIASFHS